MNVLRQRVEINQEAIDKINQLPTIKKELLFRRKKGIKVGMDECAISSSKDGALLGTYGAATCFAIAFVVREKSGKNRFNLFKKSVRKVALLHANEMTTTSSIENLINRISHKDCFIETHIYGGNNGEKQLTEILNLLKKHHQIKILTGRVTSKSLDAVSAWGGPSDSIAVNAKNGKIYTNIEPSLFSINPDKEALYRASNLKTSYSKEKMFIDLVLTYNNGFCVEEMNDQEIQIETQNLNDCR